MLTLTTLLFASKPLLLDSIEYENRGVGVALLLSLDKRLVCFLRN